MNEFTLEDLLQIRQEYTDWETTQELPDDCLLRELSENRYGSKATTIQHISIAFVASRELTKRLLAEKELWAERKDVCYDC